MYHTLLLYLLESHRDCRPKTDTSIGLLLARYSPALAVQGPGSAGASKNPTKRIQRKTSLKTLRKLTIKISSKRTFLQKKSKLVNWSLVGRLVPCSSGCPSTSKLPLDFKMSYQLYPVKWEGRGQIFVLQRFATHFTFLIWVLNLMTKLLSLLFSWAHTSYLSQAPV